ncbi:FCD domain-containing protein [Rhizobium sp. Root149]|uniref:FadR/GntR family transcriptional regulator n=1 Tax=Rhizobium sp. Root149 TaxID=1736473 RepID=UPI0009EC450A|nr:FCD domain-containing protein [Rhizobium sp. Root149]
MDTTLATKIGCSRGTLRSALDRLEREGILWRHVGQGTFLGPRPRQEPIRPQVLFEMASPTELMRARIILEPPISAVAAVSAGSQDVALLRELALRSREATDWAEYEAADDAFHKALAAVTGNHLLMAVLGMLSTVRGRAQWQRGHDAAFSKARKREYALRQGDVHLAIVDAVANKNGVLASETMRQHLAYIDHLFSA